MSGDLRPPPPSQPDPAPRGGLSPPAPWPRAPRPQRLPCRLRPPVRHGGPEVLAPRGSRRLSVRQADGCRGRREDGGPSE